MKDISTIAEPCMSRAEGNAAVGKEHAPARHMGLPGGGGKYFFGPEFGWVGMGVRTSSHW